MEQPPPLQPSISSGAGFGIRLLARLIDFAFGFVLGFFAGVLGGIILAILARSGVIDSGWQYRVRGTNLPAFLLSNIGVIIYHSITEGMYGASLGKVVCQLRVVSENAEPITMWQAFLRSIAYFVDALFFGLIGYSSMRKSELNQRYGDHWARTIVIKRKDAPELPHAGGEVFVLAVMMGAVCWIVLLAIGVVIHAS
jgi:uncharacterized RDD family membrane protein YckC